MKRLTILTLCAFALAAVIGAAGASAAVETTTAWTCVEGGNEGEPGHTQFTDADCTEPVTTGKYGHVTIPAKTSTELQQTSLANPVLKTTIAGAAVTLEVTASNVSDARPKTRKTQVEKWKVPAGAVEGSGSPVSSWRAVRRNAEW